LEYLDGIVYRALQALGCVAASTPERETANYQGRVGKRQPPTAIEQILQVTRWQMQFARSQGFNFRSIHLQTRGRVRYGSFLYATAASRRPRAESKPPACSMKTHKHNRTLQKRPEQLPTGLSFCTKVDGFDPSKRVVGLKGIQRLQLPVKPPVAAGRALS